MTATPHAIQMLNQGGGWVALDKPSGVAPPESGPESRAMLRAAGLDVADDAAWRVVARTEREASGVLMLADRAAHSAITAALASGDAIREHEAIVRAYVVGEEQSIEEPLDYDKRAGRMRVRRNGGTPATTRIRVIERVAGHTLLSCIAQPGLLHQVRCHLEAADYPLAVDPVYGGGQQVLLSEFKSAYRTSTRHEERPLLARLSLHIVRMHFHDPRSGEEIRILAERPKDFRATLTQLARCGDTKRGRR